MNPIVRISSRYSITLPEWMKALIITALLPVLNYLWAAFKNWDAASGGHLVINWSVMLQLAVTGAMSYLLPTFLGKSKVVTYVDKKDAENVAIHVEVAAKKAVSQNN